MGILHWDSGICQMLSPADATRPPPRARIWRHSERLFVDGADVGIGGGTAPADAQILHLVQRKCAFSSARGSDRKEIRAFYVVQIEGGTNIGDGIGNFHVAHLKVAHVT